ERFGQKIIRSEAEPLYLIIELAEARQNQDRRPDPGGAQPAQDLIAVHVRQQQVEDNDVVIVQFADFEPVFPEIGGVANETFFAQPKLDVRGRCGIVLNQQNAHREILWGKQRAASTQNAFEIELA